MGTDTDMGVRLGCGDSAGLMSFDGDPVAAGITTGTDSGGAFVGDGFVGLRAVGTGTEANVYALGELVLAAEND